MTADLETRLTAALRSTADATHIDDAFARIMTRANVGDSKLAIDAANAHLSSPEWKGFTVLSAKRPGRPRWPRAVSIAAAIILIAAGAGAVMSRAVEPNATGYTPPGEQFPLTDEFPRTEPTPASLPTDWSAVARPGALRLRAWPRWMAGHIRDRGLRLRDGHVD